tara:strand:- start:458 stop:607 length:150 start_codon:yes stop_codon:yes gene_type:complete
MIVRYENFLTEISHVFLVQPIELVLNFGSQPLEINLADRQIKELLEIGI